MTALFAQASRKYVLRPLALLAAMAAVFATAQTTTSPTTPAAQDTTPPSATALPGTAAQREAVEKSARTLEKFNRIDILGKLLPVNLTKEQIRAMLPSVERARKKEFEIYVLDAAEIMKLDAEVSKAVDDAIAKGDVPSTEIQNRIRRVSNAITIRRQIALREMEDMVYEAIQKHLDAGQMKVMANTLSPELMAPGQKIDTDEAKVRLFIRYVFLNNLTYDILLRMSKPA